MEFRVDLLVVSVVYFGLFTHVSIGHPQCLDSRPPFQAEAQLPFCGSYGYSEFGCCTINGDEAVRTHYISLENKILARQPSLWNRCKNYAKTFLCQTCSPYAAHIFDSEISQIDNSIEPRKFPGLCGTYCSTFYQTCHDLVQYYMDEMGSKQQERMSINNATNEAEFCSAVSLHDKIYCYPDLLTSPVLNGNIQIEQITKEGCVCVEPITEERTTLRNPIFLKHADDGSNRMFVGEQIGLVHIFYPDGRKLPEPFLDIRDQIHTTSYKGDERGMLGMTFHPKYKENGKFYMYYSTPLSDLEYGLGDHKIRIEEMRVNSSDPNKADASQAARKTILEVIEPFWNHNGGEILFGDDNYMYIFVGDGGKAGDTLRAGQNLTMMLGKVLRIDVDVPAGSPEPYRIPPDNPFADGVDGRLPEIYAYGVRNIWRCGKDRGDPKTGYGKGRIVCGDVGQSAREELDLIEKGANYGWNLKEGIANYCPDCMRGLPDIPLTEPIHDYPHAVGRSITGGNFYRGCHSPNLNGYYIYGDFMNGVLFRIVYNETTKRWDNKELTMCGPDKCVPPLQGFYSTSIISFGEDETGEIYMLSTSLASTAVYEGDIYRIVDPSRRGNPAHCTPQTPAPTTPTPTTPAPTTPTPTTPAPTMTTKKDTSAAVIPLFSGSQMANYLDYFRRRSHQAERRKLQRQRQQQQRQQRQQQHQQNQQQQQQQQVRRGKQAKKPSKPARRNRQKERVSGKLTFHGINVHRCTSWPRIRCDTNRILPRN